MDASSRLPCETARKISATVLQAIAARGASTIATASGLSESMICRLKSDHLDHFAKLLAFGGLKVVPACAICVTPEYLDSLRLLAREALSDGKPPAQLEWD